MTKTKVVNVYKDQFNVYIGRAGKGKDGYFGNDHPIGFCKICNIFHLREQAIECFKKDFKEKIESDQEFLERVLELKDKALGCFCKNKGNELCHGDVYVEWLNDYFKE